MEKNTKIIIGIVVAMGGLLLFRKWVDKQFRGGMSDDEKRKMAELENERIKSANEQKNSSYNDNLSNFGLPFTLTPQEMQTKLLLNPDYKFDGFITCNDGKITTTGMSGEPCKDNGGVKYYSPGGQGFFN